MTQAAAPSPNIDDFVKGVLHQYRLKLLDLSSRNPLVSFKHSERSRSHIRVVNEIPEILFSKLESDRQLTFDALKEPELIAADEMSATFESALRRGKREDKKFAEDLAALGPSPSDRQKKKIERRLRDRVRADLGMPPFEPTLDPKKRAKELGINPEHDLPKGNGQPARHFNDLKVQTLHFPDDLAKKLSGIRDSARVLLEDAGLTALYVAFGFLEYYESSRSDESRLAPLLFYPVELIREIKDSEYRYSIKTADSDVEINVALAELLKTQLNIELPSFVQAEEDTNALGAYLSKIESLVANRDGWRVRRNVTLGLFTFSTLAMYKDLDPQRWEQSGTLEKHPVIRTLVAGVEVQAPKIAEDYNIDAMKQEEILLVTEADSSQHSAIVDVLNGKSTVIQGPPGTGKSQTITNLIAAALGANKTVLFVAEKMAALDVVSNRLTAAGLGEFCMELHSTKTSKASVIASLASRLEYGGPRLSTLHVQSNADALARAKKDLIYYVNKANEPAGETGLTVQEVLLGSAKREIQNSQQKTILQSVRLPNALALTTHKRKELLASLMVLEQEAKPIGEYGPVRNHPWRGLTNTELTEFDFGKLIGGLERSHSILMEISQELKRVEAETQSTLVPTLDAIQILADQAASLNPPADIDPELYSKLVSPESRKLLLQAIELLLKLDRLEESLAQVSTSPFILVTERANLRTAAENIAKLGLEQCHFEEMQGILQEFKAKHSSLTEALDIARRLAARFGVDVRTFSDAHQLMVAVELLAALPAELLPHRTERLLDPQSNPFLKATEQKGEVLNKKLAAISRKFDLGKLPESKELQKYVYQLRTTNFVTSIFSRGCREAKRLYRYASKHPEKINRAELAQEFDDCSRLLEEMKRFKEDKDLISLCGKLFKGLDTPFKSAIQLNEWGKALEAAPLRGDMGTSLRKTLSQASNDELAEISRIASDGAFTTLRNILQQSVGLEREGIQGRVALHAQRVALLENTVALTATLGIRPETKLTSLISAFALADQVAAFQVQFDGDTTIKDLMGIPLSTARTLQSRLRSTSQFARLVESTRLPNSLKTYLFKDVSRIATLNNCFASLVRQAESAKREFNNFETTAKLDAELWNAEPVSSAPLESLISRSKRALEGQASLRDYLKFLIAEEDACEQGAGPVLKAFEDVNHDYRELESACQFVFFRSAAEQVLNADPRLKQHSGSTHEKLRKQFQELDREYLSMRRKVLASQLLGRDVPDGNSYGRASEITELALIQKLAGQTRPRTSLRDVFQRAAKAIQGLKPCWMMSPMSVAQFLKPGQIKFDLVVMDEASQIRPEEAIGAIARGGQIVVVGDQMQLPPTSFFQKLSSDSGAIDEDEVEDVKAESILETAAARFHPSRRLKWHYRSEHGSLISFSNQEFYSGDLTVFPSPYHDDPGFGVQLVQVGGRYKSGVNADEVKAVIDAACLHMAQHPKRSLGIVAVNSKQSELIRESIDRVFATDPKAEAFRSRWEDGLESFFVKNLENVQGDERDIIFISTVYGPDEAGNFHQRFGPINGEYGHRRLNVLFTRAKKKVVLFSSMVPEDIQDEGKHWGVRALKGYIQYARDGRLPASSVHSQVECDSEFEQWVRDVLKANGFEVVPQLGYAGYRIDLAVSHPKHPGSFICGIECDGATYHSAKSVRERDRLRQEILENLGWKLYRIWSTDWFRNPELQTRNLIKYIEALVRNDS